MIRIDALTLSLSLSLSVCTQSKVLLHCNRHHDALSLYHEYAALNDNVSRILALRACSKLLLFHEGRHIHESMEMDNVSDSDAAKTKRALIQFYGESGDVEVALDLYQSMDFQNASCCNAILDALIRNGKDHDAVRLHRDGNVLSDAATPVLVLKALSNTKDGALYLEMKGDILNIVDAEKEQHVLAVIECARCFEDIEFAQNTVDSLDRHQVTGSMVSAVMRMLTDSDSSDSPHSADDALDFYERHRSMDDRRVHSLALKCCAITKCHEFGEEIISEHFGTGLDVVDSMALISFYGSFDVDAARRIFEGVGAGQQTVESVSCWMTTLIENGRGRDALSVFDEFSALRDDVTDLLAMKAAIDCGDFESGKAIESRVSGESVSFKNVLIDFYGHFDRIEAAEEVFASIPDADKSIVTVGSMLSAYSRCRQYNRCRELFESMDQLNDSLKPNVVCYRIVFSACAEGTIFHFGRDLHRKLRQSAYGKILRDRSVQIHLIKMYGKMGATAVCDGIFEDIEKYQVEEWRNEIAIWNAMIGAHGHCGDVDRAQRICRRMIDESNVMPDERSYIQLLSACGHCGEMETAQSIWTGISNPDIKYDSFVVTALVDCFARNGALNEGYRALMDYEEQKMERNPNDKAMWMAMLSGCRKHKDGQLAKTVFEAMCSKEFGDEAMSEATVLMTSILAAVDQSEDVPSAKLLSCSM